MKTGRARLPAYVKLRGIPADMSEVSRSTRRVAGWRAWGSEGAPGAGATSSPLRETVRVRNRWFPKTRSWFALGAPLELLSPLSVLRVLYLIMALVWPALALALGEPRRDRWVLAAVTACAAGVWVGLMEVAAVGRRACRTLLLGAAAAAALAAWSGHGGAVSAGYLLLWVPIGALTTLFAGARTVTAQAALGAAAVWVCAEPHTGAGAAGALVGVAVVVQVAATVPLALCARAARRHDTVDPDTGLPNGYGLSHRLAARGAEGPYVVAVSTLTGLGEAREALGYRAGTELLQRAVENLGQVVPLGTLIGRVEGDEVVVVAPAGAGGEESGERALIAATAAADALVATIGAGVAGGSYIVNGVEITLRTHVGIALAPWDGDDLTELIRRASLSARRAMAAGEPHRVWDGDQGALTADDLALLSELRLAGGRGELWLAYQPQVDAISGATVAVEALLRWDSPARGAVSPGRFVPLAERTGLIGRLTEWVLAEALDAQVRWRLAGVILPVSVNLSATLLSRRDLSEWILAELEGRALPADALTVEVTETAETTDIIQAVTLLRPLRARGVRISLDDFGTGYTSLAALPDLPLDELKVDQGFVRRSATSAADDAIVQAVVELAHRLGFAVVAEGVEDAECARRLSRYGVDLLQGYHYSRPVNEADLLAFAARPPVTVAGSLGGDGELVGWSRPGIDPVEEGRNSAGQGAG